MLSHYHIKITEECLQSFFAPAALREISRANVTQDSLPSMFGVDAHRHVCDCAVADSLAYIDEEHATIAQLAVDVEGARRQHAALGRLLHTVQDFFAHTNYVALWRAAHRNRPRADHHAAHPGTDEPIAGEGQLHDSGAAPRLPLDMALLEHPQLKIAQWCSWRDPLYYIPGVGALLRRVWLPASSHEAINLDSPSRGVDFHLAMHFARQWTLLQYARAFANVAARGGAAAVARFHGVTEQVPQRHTRPLSVDA